MFTGIVEAVASVVAIDPEADVVRITLHAPEVTSGVRIGDSVAVNGGCLTVTECRDGEMRFEAVRETLDRTSLGDLRVGSRVNVERAMRADGRLDGHIVQGHVDGTGRIRRLQRDGDDVRLYVDCGPEITDYLVEKGSVAVDGVSLTVVGVAPEGFDVALIPHTLAETTLGDRRPGDRVNLETDVLGKYVVRYLERTRAGRGAQA